MEKIDLKKTLKHLYQPSAKEIALVDVPEMNFLMVDGEGDPNTSKSFSDAIEALYPVSYTLKFMVKKGEMGIDYGVMPLEALWWADDLSAFTLGKKDEWKWTVMVMQPDFITREMVNEALAEVARKKNPVSLPHIGHFTTEGPTIEKVHQFIADNGSHQVGKHHEIYLSDLRRTAPEKWKTIVRQPMS
jgi:hypothetical protein